MVVGVIVAGVDGVVILVVFVVVVVIVAAVAAVVVGDVDTTVCMFLLLSPH